MSKVLFWLIDIIVVLLATLFVTLSLLAVSHSIFDSAILESYVENWNSGAITDIVKGDVNGTCIDGYENMINNFFPTTNEGCDCTNSEVQGLKGNIFGDKCTYSHIADKCKMIFPTNGKVMNIWKGTNLCIKRTSDSFWQFENEILVKGEKRCRTGLKLCGVLDTSGNKLCLNKNETCPINSLIISDQPPSSAVQYSSISIDDETSLYFTNKLINYPVITNITVSSNPICANPTEGLIGENNYILNSFKGPSTCQTVVDKTTEDPRFKILDSDLLSNFYTDNGINKIIDKLPYYPVPNANAEAHMSQISYIGWSKSCMGNQEFNLTTLVAPQKNVEGLNSNVYSLSIFCIFHFCITLLFIVVYKIWIAEFSVSPRILFVFDCLNVGFIILILVLASIINSDTNSLLEPYNTFLSLKCGDDFTNYSFKLAYYPLLYITNYIVPIIVCTSIEIAVLLIHYGLYFFTASDPFKADIKYS